MGRGGCAPRCGEGSGRAAVAGSARLRRVPRRAGRFRAQVRRHPPRLPVARADAHRRGGERAASAYRTRARRALRRGAPIVMVSRTKPKGAVARRGKPMSRAAALFVALAVAALLGATDGNARQTANPMLFGNVGPGFTITLKDASGARVARLDPGTYDIQVTDQAEEHNF